MHAYQVKLWISRTGGATVPLDFKGAPEFNFLQKKYRMCGGKFWWGKL